MWRAVKYLFIIGLILFNSCEEERKLINYCEDMGRTTGTVSFSTFEDISEDSIICKLRNIEYSDWNHPVLYIINDQDALDTLIQCSSYNFNFNFEEYTLLIGYFFTSYGPAILSNQEVELECRTLEQYLSYSVTVDVVEDDRFRDTLIQHNAIVPKFPGEMRVNHWVKRNRLYLEGEMAEVAK